VKIFCPHCRHATETSAWASGNIQYLRALPSDPLVISTVEALVVEAKVVLVVEDSNHLAEVQMLLNLAINLVVKRI
jgi:cephalosporin hydroxylase